MIIEGKTYKILGVDPGTSHVGFAVVDASLVPGTGMLKVELSFHTTARPFDIDLYRTWANIVYMAGVEMPEGRNGTGGIKYVSPTAVVGGVAAGIMMDNGLGVRFLYPRHWRKALCGRGAVKDSVVKERLANKIRLPRTNNHVRDAVGVALAVAEHVILGKDIGNGMEAVRGKG